MDSQKELEKRAEEKQGLDEEKKAEEERARLEAIPEFKAFFTIGTMLRKGQAEKGCMTLTDTKTLMVACEIVFRSLQNIVVHEDNPASKDNESLKEPVKIKEDQYRALNYMHAVADAMQSTGVYSFEESVDILDSLQLIDDLFKANLDEGFARRQKEASLQNKQQELKEKRTKKPNNKNNKKR